MSTGSHLSERLKKYLGPDNVSDRIATYLQPGMYTGSLFEHLASADEPNRITVNDLVAVSMLSVTVPPATRNWLLTDGAADVADLLSGISEGGGEPDIAVQPELLSQGTAAWELWYLLRTGTGMGPTTTSKLMAVKRPRLIPIHDSVVSKALNLPIANSWQAWGHFMRDGWKLHRDKVRRAAIEAGGGHLSDLRIIDITVWLTESSKRTTTRKFVAPDPAQVPTAHRRERD